MDAHEERVMDWCSDIIAAYVRIAKVLARLVLPIELPMNMNDTRFIRDAQAAIVRSLALIEDQPMGELLLVTLRQVLLDWLTAMDLAAIELEIPMSWREPAFEYTIMRTVAGVDLALEMINEE